MVQILTKKLKYSFSRLEFSEVSYLDPENLKWKIKVKLIKKFMDVSSVQDTVRLIFIDDKGDRIEAILNDEYVENQSNSKFIEDYWFVLEGFDLVRQSALFRFSSHPFHIRFNTKSTMRKVSPVSSSYYLFSDAFEDINKGLLDPQYCVDLIGEVRNVGNFTNRIKSVIGRSNVELFFDLYDEKNTCLKVKLPRDYVETFMHSYSTFVDEIVICVMKFAKLEQHKGVWWATTYLNCTDVILNPPDPQVTKLKKLLSSTISSP